MPESETVSPVPGLTLPASDTLDHGGDLHSPHEASGNGGILWVPRTCKVPLALVPDDTWQGLRRLAYQCATYGNALLSAQYAAAKGLRAEWSTYTDHAGVLSAAVRDAVGREVVGLWRRLGRKILCGEQTLGRFSVSRALVVRDRGVRLRNDGGRMRIVLRVHPQSVAPATELPVWMPGLKKDPWLISLLDKLSSGRWPLTKATVLFERPRRKIAVLLTYERPSAPYGSRLTATAEIGPVEGDGSLWLRCEGRALSLADSVHRLRQMKEHFAGIHRRLRRCLGKRSRRQDHRKALLKAGSFEAWAEGPLHILSRQIVTWCVEAQAGTLLWRVQHDGSLPWERLYQLVGYKAEELGIEISQIERVPAQREELRSEEGGDLEVKEQK